MSKAAFDPVPSPFNFAEAEHAIIHFWKNRDTYKKSLAQREGEEQFIFYEGPPTANGLPHPGHALTRTIKDIFPRYKTMDGFYCERKAGWDTHGLPVEIEVQKELGIIEGGKAAIEEYGVERFNRACIESVFRYTKEWEELTDRIGFWVNLEEAYVTFHQSYVESVWWALKQLFDRGLLYQGHKVVWWWAQGGTALSAGEVGEGYRDTDDPAITVKLTLTEESTKHIGLSHAPAHFLIWTTTPWTLSSNTAAAVGEDIEYAIVKTTREDGSHEFFILAASLVESYFEKDAEVLRVVPGQQLVGLSYKPIFHYDTPSSIEGSAASTRHWQVIAGDFVDISTGTGIVHLAPAFGEDDYRACKENGIGFLCFVKPDGTFDERVTDVDPYDKTPIAGQFCKAADKSIIKILKERGQIVKHEQYRHPYPFCPRADQDPLIQYARKSWFIRTSEFKEKFLLNNKEIHWQPEHIRDGRFGNFLENNVDWALSRERYWGTPLPVWICEKTGHMEAVASYTELLAKPDVQGTEVWAAAKAADPKLSEHLKVHKPYIDSVTYQSPAEPSARMRRVTEVIDVWFDAGSMPFAQWGYPHVPGSVERFWERFPADFISEAIDQTRGWFYALLAISTVVFDWEHISRMLIEDYKEHELDFVTMKPSDAKQEIAHKFEHAERIQNKVKYPHPFKNVICLGHIQGEDGLKLSKRLKNYKEPKILFEKFSADALRWSFIYKTPPTSSSRLSERIVEEAQRELLVRWYNVYSFFVIYANLDGFDPSGAPAEILEGVAAHATQTVGTGGGTPYAPRDARAELDRWILHELDRTVVVVREALDKYEPYPASRAILDFVDGLSNWYVRRSRPRFWASEWSQDKADAYWTLYECLLTLARLAAPFVPFFTEHTWQNLVKPLPGAVESVHLASYPRASIGGIDAALLNDMATVREAVTLGLSARRSVNIKVRQPLAQCEIVLANPQLEAVLVKNRELILEELNIKELAFTDKPEEYVAYEVRPNFKVLGPKFGKKVQAVKAALATGDGARFYRELQEGNLHLEIEGETVELSGEDLEVRLAPKEGFAAAQGRHMVVVIATEISEALRREGLVRDFIRIVQEERKAQNLPYDARIEVTYSTGDAELAKAGEEFAELIRGEVLADKLTRTDNISDGKASEIDGKEVVVRVNQIKQ